MNKCGNIWKTRPFFFLATSGLKKLCMSGSHVAGFNLGLYGQ